MKHFYCLNCKEDLTDKPVKLFQGEVVCDTCQKVAARLLERAETEMKTLLQLYKDILRVAIVKGELNFTQLPNATGKAIRKIHEDHTQVNG